MGVKIVDSLYQKFYLNRYNCQGKIWPLSNKIEQNKNNLSDYNIYRSRKNRYFQRKIFVKIVKKLYLISKISLIESRVVDLNFNII